MGDLAASFCALAELVSRGTARIVKSESWARGVGYNAALLARCSGYEENFCHCTGGVKVMWGTEIGVREFKYFARVHLRRTSENIQAYTKFVNVWKACIWRFDSARMDFVQTRIVRQLGILPYSGGYCSVPLNIISARVIHT